MYAVAGRRSAAVVAAGLALGGLVAGTAQAAGTGDLTYSCALPAPIGATDFQISADSNAPATLYLGKSFTPTLTTIAKIPVNLANLVGGDPVTARSVDGTITSKVKINGVVTPIVQTIKNQPIPASTTKPVPVTATGPMPKLTAAKPGTITYLPGDLVVSLSFHKAGGGSAGNFGGLNCTLVSPPKTIDKVVYATSPSKVTGTAAYAKASKKVTATAKVTAASGLVPTGKVTAVLYKGATKLKTVAATLKAGKATATFARVSAKGAYKVVLTYAGSATTNGSSASKAFTVR